MGELISEATIRLWGWVFVVTSVFSLMIWFGPLRRGFPPRKGLVDPWKASWVVFFAMVWLVFGLGVLIPLLLIPAVAGEWPAGDNSLGMSVAMSMGMQLVMLLVLFVASRNWKQAAGVFATARQTGGVCMRLGLVRFVQLVPLVWLVQIIFSHFAEHVGLDLDMQEAVRNMLNIQGVGLWIAAGVSAVILAPIVEELVFRGVIYRFLKGKLGVEFAMVFSAAMFSLVHFHVSSLLPLFVFGLVLALVFEESGDIRVPILVHGFFNLQTMGLIFAERFVLNPPAG